ncbi:hypothetical protein HYT55_02075 [Candidatus Woesearchaeota archaeon]|nr:hypothetical protein [Candidatus Woesearchaeota archaeon]
MSDLDQKVDDLFKRDLAGLVRTANEHGYQSEEVRTYAQETAQHYKSSERKEEYLRLCATTLVLMESSGEDEIK